MWLTKEELQEMTDLQRPDAIRRWLTENGYAYEVSARGWPKVLRSLVESRLGGIRKEPKRPRLHLV
ncbi:DUF4224 domain-containing protein [Uliginosibacterium sp. sgz301328]|uniref:DUF4224 domain-containing protein n=1 Tax=Uliginosibacterium sp. sgz301328 TaxID=3243764 RepID=UPI00359EF53F